MSDSLVIIPTYNEILNIEAIIEKTLSLKDSFEILIVDDGSPDGTGNKVKELQQKHARKLHLLERPGKQGLGTAYIVGFNWALAKEYKYIFEMDADFSHNPSDLLNLYDACANKNADLAIGSRYISGVNVVNWPIGRVIMSYYASAYVRFISGMKIMDTTAGFKCYRREVLQAIDFDRIKFKGYAFQIEMKFTAYKFKFNIVEVPIIFTDRKKGKSKMSGGIFNEALWGVIIMKWKSLFRKYTREKLTNNTSLI
ncbi:MAG: polyprenol monophosphomannose synthase [Bacteroidales bacterium]|nr:polyprenol monophosphomannose synthase [Bacteroidales bacterium]MBN2757182.1 polyprenol monophosphomannose synthase [Bacteroidales bacterium]